MTYLYYIQCYFQFGLGFKMLKAMSEEGIAKLFNKYFSSDRITNSN